ncbi:MAG: monovalent cation/H(+) antiporter subunit G [Pseudomonadota bacterium]
MSDIVLSVLLVASGVFALIGGLGVLRLPDVLIRMHASTKIGTLACGLVMAATALHFGSTDSVMKAVVIVLFLFLTAPIAAHMIGRAAVNTGVPLWRIKPDVDGDAPSKGE